MRSLLVAIALLALLCAGAPTAALGQRADGLDQPLAGVSACGPGDGSEVHFTIAATGDTFPHANIQAVGEAQGYAMLFDHVRPFLQAADLAYTNFDGAMLAGAGYSGYPTFNFNPALATALREAGIGLVSTANNHILDRGPEGLDATLGVLEANGILQHGAAPSAGPPRPPYLPITLSRDGVSIRVGFLAASWGTNGLPDPYGQVNLLYQSSDYNNQGGVRQEILAAVSQAAAETDLVIVAAHWGHEYEFYPRDTQITAARQLAEAGADVILGAQSHTLQPVDLIDLGGRRALVIYSLANFLASQGAFQQQSYSATAVIFYVGLARAADGQVRVTGYRYLPTIHIDNDTRPAPIQPGSEEGVIAHVRTILRDPTGARQISAAPPAGPIAVCPPILLGEAPDTPIPGDFAQHYLTLGDGLTPRPLSDGIAVFGLPLGPVVAEPTGDCTTPTKVLYTERQRLELAPQSGWPGRVVGTHLGAHSFAQRYPTAPLERRTDLAAPEAFADPRFRSFFEQYGGLPIFGYPISGALSEADPLSGGMTTVQYFERTRFELTPDAPADAPLTAQVRLGLLGRELGGLTGLCGSSAATSANSAETTSTGRTEPSARSTLGALPAALAQVVDGVGWWMPLLAVVALLVAISALGFFAFNDWRSYRQRGTRHGYRRRRSAHERFAYRPAQEGDGPALRSPAAEATRPEADDWDQDGARPALRRGYAAEAAGPQPAEWLEEHSPPAGASFSPQPTDTPARNGWIYRGDPDDESAEQPPPRRRPPLPDDDQDELLKELLGQ